MIHVYSEKYITRTRLIEEGIKRRDSMLMKEAEGDDGLIQVSVLEDNKEKEQQTPPLKENLRIYSHEQRFAILMAHQDTSSIQAYKPAEANRLLDAKECEMAFLSLKAALKYQTEKLEIENEVIPQKLKFMICK